MSPFATGGLNAVLLVGALHAELSEGRKQEVIDDYLQKIQFLSSRSAKEAQKLVTAGVVPRSDPTDILVSTRTD
jgi:hypothetical protein